MSRKTVLITGASSGIGLATARVFLAKGWNVVAGMRSPPADAAALNEGFTVVRLDVTDAVSISRAVRTALSRFGRIDVLVNNAGYAQMGPVEGLSIDEIRSQFETNLFGLAAITQEVLPAMRDAGDGVVVNVSSVGGRMAFPFASAYHATKFAVEGFSESMRYELRPKGVRVKLVEPGGIKTNFIHRGTRWASHPAYEPALARFQSMAARLNDRLPGPDRTAHIIYRAATDGTDRLRYYASAGPYPALHALLPDAMWRRLVGLALQRHAGGSAVPGTAPQQAA